MHKKTSQKKMLFPNTPLNLPEDEYLRENKTIFLHNQGISPTLNLTLTVEKRRLNTLNQRPISAGYPFFEDAAEQHILTNTRKAFV